MLGDLAHGWRPAEPLRERRNLPVIQEHELLEVARHAHGPRLVAETALELADDRERCERRERDAPFGIVAIDRVQQADGGDLREILEWLPAANETPGQIFGERLEPRDQLGPRLRLLVESVEQLTDVLVLA